MVDFDSMRGMHDYYGQAERLFDRSGKFVGLDEDMPTISELKAFHAVEYSDQDFFDWLEENFDVLYDVDGDETDYYAEK